MKRIVCGLMVGLGCSFPVLAEGGAGDAMQRVEYRAFLDIRSGSDVVTSTWRFSNKGLQEVQIGGIVVGDASGRQEYAVNWVVPGFSEDKEFELEIFNPVLSGTCEFSVGQASFELGKTCAIDSVADLDAKMLRVGPVSTHNSNRRSYSSEGDVLSFHVYNPARFPLHVSKVSLNVAGYNLDIPSDFRLDPMTIQEVYVCPPLMPSKKKIESVLITGFSKAEDEIPTPEEVAVEFLKAMESGNVEAARKHVELVTYGGLEKWAEKIAENKRAGFKLKRVDSKIGSDKKSATVTAVYEVRSNDGSETVQDDQTVKLVKENGYWRVHFDKE